MKICLIGAGNVATHLGQALYAAGHDILQVYSHTEESARLLAERLGASAATEINDLTTTADVCIVSLTDMATTALVPQLCKGREHSLFLHTAGSLPMSLFRALVPDYGVLYPLQTFSKDKPVNFQEISCFVEANSESAMKQLRQLVSGLTSHIYEMSSENRKYLHLAAVFACNFSNHCYTLASNILEDYGIPFDVMLPLIDETVAKLRTLNPSQAQTGPAARHDTNVMATQRKLLDNNPDLQGIYDKMTQSISSGN